MKTSFLVPQSSVKTTSRTDDLHKPLIAQMKINSINSRKLYNETGTTADNVQLDCERISEALDQHGRQLHPLRPCIDKTELRQSNK